MGITQIASLHDCGVFRDFTWPNDLADLARYNLIYGWNASGKTTLSRLLRNLELRRVPTVGRGTIRIDGNDLRGEDFPHVALPVRVFNRDFVTESIFPLGGGDVPPIYVVGKDSVEKQKQAERLKAERSNVEDALTDARSKRHEADRILDRFCQDRARVIKDTLRSPGSSPYNNYDKNDFRQRAEQMAADANATLHRLNEADREKLLAQQQATQKPKVSEVTYVLPTLPSLADSVSAFLARTVVSAAIESLKGDTKLADWTRDGLSLHRNRPTTKCLFCGQGLPEGRLAALEAHFSAEYEQFLRELDEQLSQLGAISQHASTLITLLPKRAELYDDIASEYDVAARALRETLDTVRLFLVVLNGALTKKKAHPFNPMALDNVPPVLDEDAVERVNLAIRKHNQACDEFRSRISTARERLALDMIAGDVDEFVALMDAAQQSQAAIPPLEREGQRLAEEITRLESDIIEHQQPADDLNEDLRKYLSHGELQLTTKDTGYCITRNGLPADMLSEGETTAIALLYFLKSLEDRQLNLREGVVVLDDPVSSLDQNSLFAAFGYIRARTSAAAQVLILTHNFLFFRLVRDWFGNLRGSDKKAWRVFMLECTFDGRHRSAKIRGIDPLLMDFDSEYHFLFSRLYFMAIDPPMASLEAYYYAPSIARRVVETFLAFRVPNLGGHNRLWSQMLEIDFDEVKKARIYRYMQTHSHRDMVGDADEDLTLLGESRAVLNDVLAFMRTADSDHVSRMVAKVTQELSET